MISSSTLSISVSFFGAVTQCILNPLRSMPLNQVIWRLANWCMAISKRLVISSYDSSPIQ